MNALASRNYTDHDLSSHLAPVTAKGGLRVAFFWDKIRIKSSDPQKNGTFETRLFVAKQPIGDPATISHRRISEDEAARQWPREFALFKEFEDAPSNGTPLGELPGISRSQVNLLELNGLRCIEDFYEISADQAGQLGMEVSRAHKVALAWLKKRDGEAEMLHAADAEAKALASIKAMEKRMADMEANMRAVEAENRALRSMTGGAAAAAPTGPVAAMESAASDAPYSFDDDDDFMGGGDVVSGNDDLAGGEVDPLKE